MDINTICIACGLLLVLVLFFTLRNKRSVNKMLEDNTNVVPLMMQKATQIKVSRLQQETKNDTKANEQLQKLVAAYKSNQINITEYNEKLDTMIQWLEIDL
ncbi:MAG: hypothetical protein V4592_05680 [Bacteroidota bacterium]